MSESVRRSSPVVATLRSYVRRSAQDDGVQARLRLVTELPVQRAHGFVALLAPGDEATEPCAPRGGDLAPLQRGGDPASAPGTPHRREAVVRVTSEVVERGVAHRLVALERDEEVLRSASRAFDLDRAELLIRRRPRKAGYVGGPFLRDREQRIRQVRPFGARHDRDARRRLRRSLVGAAEVERDPPLAANHAIPAAFEERPRDVVVLTNLPLELRLAVRARERHELGEERGA